MRCSTFDVGNVLTLNNVIDLQTLVDDIDFL